MSPQHPLSDKTVLITGALTGIGRATALVAAQEGCKIVVSGRNAKNGAALASELRAFGTEVEFIQADIRKESDVQNLINGVVARFGRLDIAINNAGTEGQPGPITSQTPESYAATFDTNVLGTILALKHEARAMIAQGSGSIVNVSSTYGHEGAANASMYAGSKHAVEGITKSVALELAVSGVRVNAVAPGPTETGMLNRFTVTEENKSQLASGMPLGRVGRPEEIARAILFIASDAASFVTGHILTADGGKTAG
jgi:NAD(P)-dependent dehydrogenase (short-subunit alcohol dehydrogenase family)